MTDREAESIPDLVRRGRRWPFLLGAAVVVALATFLVVRSMRAPMPLRVLIAIDVDGKWWEGSKAAATLADRLAARLSKLGFEPVRAGDPEVVRALERAKGPIDAARSLHAAFVITADIAPATLEHKLPKGAYYEVRGEAPVIVQHLDGKPREAGLVSGFGGARERPRALELLAQGLADQAFDAILPALLADDSIKELLADRQSNIAPQIYPARDFVLARDKATKDAAEAWALTRKKHLDAETGPSKPIYLSAPGAQDELAAVSALGALVATNSVRPWFAPDTQQLGWITQLETIEWRPLAGEPRVLFRGYNVFGYPHAAADRAVVIEDLFGWAKTVTVIDAAGKSTRVRIDPEHRFVDPRLSPDGKRLAVWDRPSPTEAGSLLVLSADDGRTLLELDREGGRFDGFVWTDATHLAFLHTASESVNDARRLVVDGKSRQGLYFADLGASPAALGKGRAVPEGELWSMPAAHGDLLAFEREAGANAIALFKPSDGSITTRSLAGAARTPSFSPDGLSLAFELNGEIAIAPVGGGAVKQLTQNPFRDRYPQFSSDGKHVLYETIDEDANYPKHRRLSWVAAVPVP